MVRTVRQTVIIVGWREKSVPNVTTGATFFVHFEGPGVNQEMKLWVGGSCGGGGDCG